MQCIEKDVKEMLDEKYKRERIVSLWISSRELNKELDYSFRTGNYDGFYDALEESLFVFRKIDKRPCLKKLDFLGFIGFCTEKYRAEGKTKTADMLEEESKIFNAMYIH